LDNNRSGQPKLRLTTQDRIRREKNARMALFGGTVTSVVAGVAIIAATRDSGVDAGQAIPPVQIASSTPGNVVGDATGIGEDAPIEPGSTPTPRRWSEDDEGEADEEWDDDDEDERGGPETLPFSTSTPTPRISSGGNSIVIEQPTPHTRTRSTPSR
jgi:hypothetical protein